MGSENSIRAHLRKPRAGEERESEVGAANALSQFQTWEGGTLKALYSIFKNGTAAVLKTYKMAGTGDLTYASRVLRISDNHDAVCMGIGSG